MMWTSVSCRIKYEYSLGHKTVYNCVMSYLTTLMMTSQEVSEELENKPINPWPKCNPIALNKIMINMWTK